LAADRGNGRDPEIPTESPVHVRRPLRLAIQEVSTTEPQTSATRKIAENQMMFCDRIDHMDVDLVTVGRDMILGFAGLSSQIAAMSGLPPMRRREDSEHAIRETASHLGKEAEEEAQRIVDDPEDTLNPATVGKLIAAKVEEALAAQREADRVRKLEADAAAAKAKEVADAAEAERQRIARDQDVRDKARDKRNAQYLTWSGIIVGLVVLIATSFVACGQGRSLEHDKAFAEGKQAAPIVQVPVIVPSLASASSAPVAVPVSAPAAVAPKGH